MSPAEIEKLKALRPLAPTVSVWVYAAEVDIALPRLLEERERLLEALKGLEGLGCWSSAADTDCPVCQKAEDARAFAEAPATPAPAGKEEK